MPAPAANKASAADSDCSSFSTSGTSGTSQSAASDKLADLSNASNTGVHPPTATTPVPRWLGKRVGRFRLVSLLGRGSWGRVFEAEDTTLRRRVALKLLPTVDKHGTPASDFARVASEARAAAALEHPNVIAVYEAERKGEFFYLAMELAEGGSVEELLKATGPIDVRRACTLCAEAGDALALAHECGIVHRDVKPANLLLSRSGRCKVCDFGLAAGGNVSDPLHATRAAGTAHYVAPEVVGGRDATPRSDVYSLAATLYHLLSGRRPFEGIRGRDEVLRAQVTRTPPGLGTLRPELDPGLVKLVTRAMSKDPDERPAAMAEFARGLRLFTMPVEDRPKPRLLWDLRLRPAALGLATVAGVTLVGLTLALLSAGGPAPTTASPLPPVEEPAVTMVDHAFRLDARHWQDRPAAVHVAGDFNGWSASATPLSDAAGVWRATVPLSPGLHHYKYVVTDAAGGSRWVNDDSADRALEIDDGHGGRNSGVRVAAE